jgi:hypothetical protein
MELANNKIILPLLVNARRRPPQESGFGRAGRAAPSRSIAPLRAAALAAPIVFFPQGWAKAADKEDIAPFQFWRGTMFTAGRICPKCGYARQPDDYAPECECPRCGIIYAKCRPPESTVPSDLALVAGISAADLPPAAFAGLPGERAAEAAPPAAVSRPASLPRRALAAIYTGSLALLILVPLKLLVYLAIRITHPPGSIKTLADLAALRSLEGSYYFLLALVLIYAFLFRPLVNGATWGQQKFGLTIRPAAGEEWLPAARVHFLRFAGQFLALAALPLTLAALLFGLATKQSFPGIADRLSATRQYEAGQPLPPLRYALNRAFLPAGIALIIQLACVGPLCAWMMSDYTTQAPRPALKALSGTRENLRRSQQASQARVESQAVRMAALEAPPPVRAVTAVTAEGHNTALRQNSLGFLTNLQRRHLNERGRYTADLEALVQEYGSDMNQSDEILRLIRQEVIRARMTPLGIELWVRLASGEWRGAELRG